MAQAAGHMQRCVAIAVRQMRIGSILQQALGLGILLQIQSENCTNSIQVQILFKISVLSKLHNPNVDCRWPNAEASLGVLYIVVVRHHSLQT